MQIACTVVISQNAMGRCHPASQVNMREFFMGRSQYIT